MSSLPPFVNHGISSYLCFSAMVQRSHEGLKPGSSLRLGEVLRTPAGLWTFVLVDLSRALGPWASSFCASGSTLTSTNLGHLAHIQLPPSSASRIAF